jgi:hypothetical protein
MISDYYLQIKSIFEKYAYIISGQSTTEKTYSDKKGFIEGDVIFYDDSRLDFAEVKDVDKQGKIKYRYHYMDENKDLVFRYDNARHYPDIETFPNHKHTIAGVENVKNLK